jgi:hypothetical protein
MGQHRRLLNRSRFVGRAGHFCPSAGRMAMALTRVSIRDSPLLSTFERTILVWQRVGIWRMSVQGAFRRDKTWAEAIGDHSDKSGVDWVGT